MNNSFYLQKGRAESKNLKTWVWRYEASRR